MLSDHCGYLPNPVQQLQFQPNACCIHNVIATTKCSKVLHHITIQYSYSYVTSSYRLLHSMHVILIDKYKIAIQLQLHSYICTIAIQLASYSHMSLAISWLHLNDCHQQILVQQVMDLISTCIHRYIQPCTQLYVNNN